MKVADQDGGSLLQISRNLLHFLSLEISQVQSFKGKWGVVKTKLDQLPSLITDLSEFPKFSSNLLCSELLQSVSQTLTLALELLRKCSSHEQAMGKLHMQSNLDSLSMKLDQHVQDGELLIKSGILQENPTPSLQGKKLTSRREAIRANARTLLTKLQIGNLESKHSAMDSLMGLLQEDDKSVIIAVTQGMVPVLVHLLDSSEMREKAVFAISRVSHVESCKHVLIAEGVLSHLVRVLECGSGFAKEKACVALQALSFSPENSRVIGSGSGISALMEICVIGTLAAQASAAGVLKNLASVQEIRPHFMDEGYIRVLIGLANSGTPMAMENSAECLLNLTIDDDCFRLLMTNLGVIECLKNLYDSAPTDRSQEIAIGLVKNLASSANAASMLVSSGFIPRIVNALSLGETGVRTMAAMAVSELGSSNEYAKLVGEAGCVPPLIRMLEGKIVSERETSGRALSLILTVEGNRRAFRKEEKGIPFTIQLLDPSLHNFPRKNPISILSSLSNNAKSRKQMVAHGACAHLERLSDMEVPGAKKLLESLSRGKLWNMLAKP
ncbi:hypothetical protein AMTRI_Chr06g170520 [Amborella trichopoda]